MNYAVVSDKTDRLIFLLLRHLDVQTAIIAGRTVLFVCQLNFFLHCLSKIPAASKMIYMFLWLEELNVGSWRSVKMLSTWSSTIQTDLVIVLGCRFLKSNPIYLNQPTQNLTGLGAAILSQFLLEKWCKQIRRNYSSLWSQCWTWKGTKKIWFCHWLRLKQCRSKRSQGAFKWNNKREQRGALEEEYFRGTI